MKRDTLYVQSDVLFNHPERFTRMAEMFDAKVAGIDINGAFVPSEKTDPDNIKLAQETLDQRFKPGN